jgi:hypothetical protein
VGEVWIVEDIVVVVVVVVVVVGFCCCGGLGSDCRGEYLGGMGRHQDGSWTFL